MRMPQVGIEGLTEVFGVAIEPGKAIVIATVKGKTLA
jgi:hypothetical protein